MRGLRLPSGLRPRTASLHTKLMLALAVLVALVAGGSAFLLTERDAERRGQELEAHATQLAELLSRSVADPLWNVDRKAIAGQLAALASDRDVAEVTVTAANYGTVATVGGQDTASVAGGVVRERAILHAPSQDFPARPIGTVRVVLSRIATEQTIAHARESIVAIVAAVVALLYAVTVVLLKRLVGSPIRRLEEMVDRIAGGDLDARCPVASGDELGRLAERVNAMAARLRESTASLRASEQRLRDYAETASDWFWETGPDHAMTYVSEQVRMIGVDPARAIGRHGWDPAAAVTGTPEAWRAFIERLDRRERFREFIYEMRSRDGATYYVSISGKPVFDADGRFLGFRGSAADITERRARERERDALQAQLQQAAKLEAIGRLAGGIAHDFNNLLGAALGFAGFLATDLPAGSQPHRFATRIMDVCVRGKALVGQLLAFARARDVERRVLDLVAVVESSRDLLCASLPISTALTVREPGGPLPVLGDDGELHQLLFNLCLNANDALGGGTGTIAIELDRASAQAVGAERHGRLVSGRLEAGCGYARMTVADTGSGMDEAVLARILEPFFTTKQRGRGTGLGLAVVHGLITAYGGALSIESAPGRGTTVSVYLPLVVGAPAAAADRPAEPDGRGDERVLVVDDQPELVEVLVVGLRRLGYDAHGLTEPADALAADGGGWDVVIADHVMPGLTGLTLIRMLKKRHPALLAVLYTGIQDGVPESVAREHGADAVLHKPIEPKDVAVCIRRLAEARRSAPGPDRRSATAPARGAGTAVSASSGKEVS